MRVDEISNHSSLIEFLKGWSAANGDPDVYDVGGMISIVGACLTNLAKYSIDADFEELDEVFEPAQVEILRKLLEGCTRRA